MRTLTRAWSASKVPKGGRGIIRTMRASTNPRLIEDEPVDIEKAVPAEENEPLERIKKDSTPDTSAFEE